MKSHLANSRATTQSFKIVYPKMELLHPLPLPLAGIKYYISSLDSSFFYDITASDFPWRVKLTGRYLVAVAQ